MLFPEGADPQIVGAGSVVRIGDVTWCVVSVTLSDPRTGCVILEPVLESDGKGTR